MKQSFDITGMTCSACSSAVNRAVIKIEGINYANVNLMTNSMTVDYDENRASCDDIVKSVTAIGYGITVNDNKKSTDKTGDTTDKIWDDRLKDMALRLKISIPAAILLMYVSMGNMLMLPLPAFLIGEKNAVSFAFIQFLLALPVIFINMAYYKRGFKSLFYGAPNMDSLIAVGSTSAVIYGIFAIFKMSMLLGLQDFLKIQKYHHNLYFESAVMILTLITLGKYFETKSKKKTYTAISSLIKLRPNMTHLITGEKIEDVDIDEIKIGDILQVRLGESVPLDGIIVSGVTVIDESAITGESIPVEKGAGDSVIGATINKGAVFTLKVTSTGSDTVLSKIIELVKNANATKAPIESIADKISSYFVPAVISIAVITFAVWKMTGATTEFALNFAISVLVISCPCALGLATPVAIMVGTGQGAKNGLLFKSAESLETMHLIDTVVFDKTGTVTQGTPMVTDIILSDRYLEDDFLKMATSLEQNSQQPLAKAIVSYGISKVEPVAVSGFSEIIGRGVKGIVDEKSVIAGNLKFMTDNNIVADNFNKYTEKLSDEGKTPVFFAIDGLLSAIIGISDIPKNTSALAIEKLKSLGINTIMLTGDNMRTAKNISEQLKLDDFISDVMPDQKDEEIARLRNEGRKVAMVGDGINDSVALSRADVGIAVGSGSDVAIDSADIILMKSDLQDVVTTIRLSRLTIKNIKENLFWAFFYNIICIPLAAGVLYEPFGISLNPMIASVAMGLSSIFVVSNALRLRGFKADKQVEYIKSKVSDKVKTEVIKMEDKVNNTGYDKTIHIDGMMCVHCKANVEKALNALSGVSATADLETKTASLKLTVSVDDSVLKKAIEDAGYTVTEIK